MGDVLNQELLDELRMIMEDEFPSLMETFLVESARQFGEAQAAWVAGDMEVLRRSTHALKGSCGNIGAEALQSTCETMESTVNDGLAEGVQALLDIAGHQLGEVNSAIQAL